MSQPPQDPTYRFGPGVPTPPPPRKRPSTARIILAIVFTVAVLGCCAVFVVPNWK